MGAEGLGRGPGGWGGVLLPFVLSPSLAPASAPRNGPALLGPAIMPRTVSHPTILVFDSGLGGLTVYREVARARPDAVLVYAADDAGFPYGGLDEGVLVSRVVAVIGRLIAAHKPDIVVVACNTASTIVLPKLRTQFRGPLRRDGAGDQAGLRRLGDQAGLGARHRGHGDARIYPQPDPRIRRRLRGDPGGLAPARHFCRAPPARRARVRRSDRRRDRAMLRRPGCGAHRHDRACLHPLSAAARPVGASGTLAGAVSRPRAGNRASRGG